ncbi:MAG: Hsp20/alpha crystallin family protein [Bradymonadia bacterium]
MLVSYQRPLQSHPSIFDWVFEPPRPQRRKETSSWVENESGYALSFDVPGVEPSNIGLSIEGRKLRLKTKRSVHEAVQENNFQWRLPRGADPEKLSATLNHGVLTLSVDKTTASLPREIEVTVKSA